jgi:uncharacterized protein (DUF1501 family)
MFLKEMAKSVGGIPSLAPMSFGPTVVEAGEDINGPLQDASNRTLVVIQLMGGNDGLNTVVPYGQQRYYTLRPTLGLQTDEILPIDGDVAFNSNMSGLMSLYQSNQAAVIQGVSYPSPNLSHYEATAIWESGSPDNPLSNGWLGRYLDVATQADSTVTAVNLNYLLPQTLQGVTSSPLSVGNLGAFKLSGLGKISAAGQQNDIQTLNQVGLNQTGCIACQEYNTLVSSMVSSGLDALSASNIIQQAASAYTPSVPYPNDDFANRLKLAAAIVTSSMKPRVVYVTLGGFDTHAAQKATQNTLLKTLSDGLAAFFNDLSAQGRANDTAIMTFSEFGRRAMENGSKGTDHGTSLPQFLIGGQVSGGLYGTYPSLTDLDPTGNLLFDIDYRQVYASVLEDWLGVDSTSVLGATWDKVSAFK